MRTYGNECLFLYLRTVRTGVYISKVRLAKTQLTSERLDQQNELHYNNMMTTIEPPTGYCSNHKNSHSDFSFHTRSAWLISALLTSSELCLVLQPTNFKLLLSNQTAHHNGSALNANIKMRFFLFLGLSYRPFWPLW